MLFLVGIDVLPAGPAGVVPLGTAFALLVELLQEIVRVNAVFLAGRGGSGARRLGEIDVADLPRPIRRNMRFHGRMELMHGLPDIGDGPRPRRIVALVLRRPGARTIRHSLEWMSSPRRLYVAFQASNMILDVVEEIR